MNTESKKEPFLQRLRYRWYRFGFWWFVVVGGLGALLGAAGLILSLVDDDPAEYGPWWLQVIAIALFGLFVAIGLKGLRIKSVSALEAENTAFERRINEFGARLGGSSPKQ